MKAYITEKGVDYEITQDCMKLVYNEVLNGNSQPGTLEMYSIVQEIIDHNFNNVQVIEERFLYPVGDEVADSSPDWVDSNGASCTTLVQDDAATGLSWGGRYLEVYDNNGAALCQADHAIPSGQLTTGWNSVTFKLRKDDNTKANLLELWAGATQIGDFKANSSGFWYIGGGDTTVAYSADTDYIVTLFWNNNTQKMYFAINGTAYDNSGAYWNYLNAGTPDTLRFASDSAASNYYMYIGNIDYDWLPLATIIDAFNFETTSTSIVASLIDVGSGDIRIKLRDNDGTTNGIVTYVFEKLSPFKPVGERIKLTVNIEEAPCYIRLYQGDTEVLRIEFASTLDIRTHNGTSYVDTTANFVLSTDVDIEIIFDETGKHSFIIDTVTYNNSGDLFANFGAITDKLTSLTFESDISNTGKGEIDDIILSWTNIQKMEDFQDKYLRFTKDNGDFVFGGYVHKLKQRKRNEFLLYMKDIGRDLEKRYGYSFQNHKLLETDISSRANNSPQITVTDAPDPSWKGKAIAISFTDTIKKYIDDDVGAGYSNLESLEVSSYENIDGFVYKRGFINDLDFKDNDNYMEFGTVVEENGYDYPVDFELQRASLTGRINKLTVSVQGHYQGTSLIYGKMVLKIWLYNYRKRKYDVIATYPAVDVWFYAPDTPMDHEIPVEGTLSDYINTSGGNDFAKVRVTMRESNQSIGMITMDFFMEYLRVKVETTERPHDPVFGKITSVNSSDLVIEQHPHIGGAAGSPYAQDADQVIIGEWLIDALSEVSRKFDNTIVEPSDKAVFTDTRGFTLIQKLKILASYDNSYWYWHLNSGGDKDLYFIPRLEEILLHEDFVRNDQQDITEFVKWSATGEAGQIDHKITIDSIDGAALYLRNASATSDHVVDWQVGRQDTKGVKEFEFSIHEQAATTKRIEIQLRGSTFLIYLTFRWDSAAQLSIQDYTGTTNYAGWDLITNDYLVFKTVFNPDESYTVYGKKPGDPTFTSIHEGNVRSTQFFQVRFKQEFAPTSEIKIGDIRIVYERNIGEFHEEYVDLAKGDNIPQFRPWYYLSTYNPFNHYFHAALDPLGTGRMVGKVRTLSAAFLNARQYMPRDWAVGDVIDYWVYWTEGELTISYGAPGSVHYHTIDASGNIFASTTDTGEDMVQNTWTHFQLEITSSTQSKLTINEVEIGTYTQNSISGNQLFLQTNTGSDCLSYIDKWDFSWSARKETIPITAQPFGQKTWEAKSLRQVSIRGKHVRRVDDGGGGTSENTNEVIVVPDPINDDPSRPRLVEYPDSPRTEFITDNTIQTQLGLKERARSILREMNNNAFNIPLKVFEYPDDLTLHVGDYVNVKVYGEYVYNQIIRRLKCTYHFQETRKGSYEIELGKFSTPALEKKQRKWFGDQEKFTFLDIAIGS